MARFGRTSAWYALASAGVVVAATVVVGVLTLWPNEAYKPITHPVEQMIERIVPGGELLRQARAVERVLLSEETLRWAESPLTRLLGADKETVTGAVHEGLRAAREGLAVAEAVPRDMAAAPADEGPSSTEGAPLPMTTSEPSSPPAAREPLPPPPAADDEPPPPTDELPPPTEEPPPLTDEPPLPPPIEQPPTGEPPSTSDPPTGSEQLPGQLPPLPVPSGS